MADFVERLRMNSIFPSGSYNPFGPGAGGGGGGGFNPDIIGPILNRIVPFLESQQRDEREFQTNTIAKQRRNQLEDIARNVAMQGKAEKAAPKNRGLVYDPNLSMTQYQKAQTQIERDKLKQTGDLAQQRIGVQQGQLGVNQQKADILAWKAKNPNSKIITPGDGRVYAVDPITNDIQDLGIDTMSIQEKLELQGNQRMEQIGAQGANAMERQRLVGGQQLTNIAANIAGRKEVKATPSGDSTGMLPTQQSVDQYLKAKRLLETNPDLADVLRVDDSNKTYSVAQTQDLAKLSRINNILNPPVVRKPVPVVAAPTATPTRTPAAAPKKDSLGIR